MTIAEVLLLYHTVPSGKRVFLTFALTSFPWHHIHCCKTCVSYFWCSQSCFLLMWWFPLSVAPYPCFLTRVSQLLKFTHFGCSSWHNRVMVHISVLGAEFISVFDLNVCFMNWCSVFTLLQNFTKFHNCAYMWCSNNVIITVVFVLLICMLGNLSPTLCVIYG